MKKKWLVVGTLILVCGCTIVKKTKYEEPSAVKESITVDLTGMSQVQRETAKSMINEIVPLIRAGKTSDEVIKTLQDMESKKITRYRVEVDNSPMRGPKAAKITIIEFSDFQCPFSKKVQPTLNSILQKYPQDVKHVFKNNPLSFHQDAPLAAEAVLAAGAQGKFWEMHTLLFENQSQLKEDKLVEYAKQLGIDSDQFKTDLSSRKFKAQVDSDLQQASRVGSTGTPAFFINGRFLSGAQPLENFVKVIDEELSGKDIPFKWGTSIKEEKKEEKKTAQKVEEDPNKIYTIPVGTSPSKGPKSAFITVVGFNDFQCPFSGRALATIDQLLKTYPTQVKYVYKNFPLGFHKDAPLAAEAALAAGAQGKFWEMHDKIYANQKQVAADNLKAYAQELNLNMKKFNDDLDTHKFKAVVDEDLKLAGGNGVRGTPTFFINGKKLVGAKPVTEFQKIIDDLLKESGKK